MPVSQILSMTLLTGLLVAPAFAPVMAADAPHHVCLNKAEQRAAVSNHRAKPLADVVKGLRPHVRRSELVRARLCHRGDDLVYVLTLLARSGKVTRTSVDAASGELIKGH